MSVTGSTGLLRLKPDATLAIGAQVASVKRQFGADPETGLFALAVHGFTWTAAARFVSTFGNVVKYLVFARLLSPFDFGVTIVALSTLDLLSALTSASFDRALIQQEADIEPYLDTVWTTSIVRGIALTAIIVLACRPIAVFFRQESAYLVFCAVTPVALLRACQSPASALMHRRMQFHLVLALNTAELFASFTVGVLAIVYVSDWRGLIIATIAGQTARTGLSYWYFPYRPKCRFNVEQARQMLRFGRWITGAGIAEFVSTQLDNFAVAHLLGPSSLGEYQLAFRIGEMPAGEFAMSASIVTFPLVARLNHDHLRWKLFIYSAGGVAVVGFAYAMGILAAGDMLLQWLFTSKWSGALPALKVLSFYGLFQGLIVIGKSFFDGIGTPVSSFVIVLTRAITLAVLIYPLTVMYGTAGAAVAALISVALPIPVMLLLAQKGRKRNVEQSGETA